MEIWLGGLLLFVKVIGIVVGFSAVAMIIGVPIALLIERLEYPPEWNEPDWGLNLIFGWFLGSLIIGLILLVVLVPSK